ncbi:hypothetical protein F5882DRAFT_58035 [Hyaloscypha sp. PMI_1271]|nr:hypothetical protein F5882DRAFT_58035 [Hyaloscypha sp. PMI_1271]
MNCITDQNHPPTLTHPRRWHRFRHPPNMCFFYIRQHLLGNGRIVLEVFSELLDVLPFAHSISRTLISGMVLRILVAFIFAFFLSAEPPASTKGGNFSNTKRTAPYCSSLHLGNPSLSFLFSFTYLQRQSRHGHHTAYSPAVDVITTVTAVSSVENVVTVTKTTDLVDIINCDTLFVSVRIVATALVPAGPPINTLAEIQHPGTHW